MNTAYNTVLCRINGTCVDANHPAININNNLGIWAAYIKELYFEIQGMYPDNNARSVTIFPQSQNNVQKNNDFYGTVYKQANTSTACKK